MELLKQISEVAILSDGRAKETFVKLKDLKIHIGKVGKEARLVRTSCKIYEGSLLCRPSLQMKCRISWSKFFSGTVAARESGFLKLSSRQSHQNTKCCGYCGKDLKSSIRNTRVLCLFIAR